MDRAILHCDLNNFYASVECMLDPMLRGKPVAVCGSVENRQGIVLAKSMEAKLFGVSTAEPVWSARQKCPELIIVPPQFPMYVRYSKLVREIYSRYTDYVESFGLDECWLDVTGSRRLFGNEMQIAEKIKEDVKKELGLTISIGVSFNKIFAKLGSDMKKPDAITSITQDDFREKIWGLPVEALLGVGPNSRKKLHKIGVYTIGQLAQSNPEAIRWLMGKNGQAIWEYANGRDQSRVRHREHAIAPKSVGHGVTLPSDLTDEQEVWRVFYDLAQDVSERLQEYRLRASSVQIGIKDNLLETKEYQGPLEYATNSSFELAQKAIQLYKTRCVKSSPIRALTIRAIGLTGEEGEQISFLGNAQKHARYEEVEKTIYTIRKKFGRSSVSYASLMEGNKVQMPRKSVPEVMPSAMYQ